MGYLLKTAHGFLSPIFPRKNRAPVLVCPLSTVSFPTITVLYGSRTTSRKERNSSSSCRLAEHRSKIHRYPHTDFHSTSDVGASRRCNNCYYPPTQKAPPLH